MNPDQTAPKEHSGQGLRCLLPSLECTEIHAADIKADIIFRTKNIGGIRLQGCGKRNILYLPRDK